MVPVKMTHAGLKVRYYSANDKKKLLRRRQTMELKYVDGK